MKVFMSDADLRDARRELRKVMAKDDWRVTPDTLENMLAGYLMGKGWRFHAGAEKSYYWRKLTVAEAAMVHGAIAAGEAVWTD